MPLREGTATTFQSVSKFFFCSSKSTPSVFVTSVANCVISGKPVVTKFCSIGNTATFQMSEKQVLKLSKRPAMI